MKELLAIKGIIGHLEMSVTVKFSFLSYLVLSFLSCLPSGSGLIHMYAVYGLRHVLSHVVNLFSQCGVVSNLTWPLCTY